MGGSRDWVQEAAGKAIGWHGYRQLLWTWEANALCDNVSFDKLLKSLFYLTA